MTCKIYHIPNHLHCHSGIIFADLIFLFFFLLDCTPYLLQLGLTKSKTSLVWIAGPLSGLIIQPLIGVIADRSRSKWGRRRPFMVFGSFVVAFCLLVLGWTAEIVGLFVKDPEKVHFLFIEILAWLGSRLWWKLILIFYRQRMAQSPWLY